MRRSRYKKTPKLIGVRDAQAQISTVIDDSQERVVILTRHGRPVALVLGCDDQDPDEVLAHCFQMRK
jgi:prevent-host-death family protein